MAMATEMTLALGRTVYGGDPSVEADSDEKIEGRETRLSVTWRLTEQEQDLSLMASVLAEEAERALKRAHQTVCKVPKPEDCPSIEKAAHIENGLKPAANTERLAAEQPATGASPEHAYAGNGNGNGRVPEPGSQPASSSAPANSYQAASGQNGSQPPMGNSASKLPDYIPPITKTQQLAIRSHCTRYGVADWELRRLLWEMFRKKEMLELRKNQAGELLMALQQTTVSVTADAAEYAN